MCRAKIFLSILVLFVSFLSVLLSAFWKMCDRGMYHLYTYVCVWVTSSFCYYLAKKNIGVSFFYFVSTAWRSILGYCIRKKNVVIFFRNRIIIFSYIPWLDMSFPFHGTFFIYRCVCV